MARQLARGMGSFLVRGARYGELQPIAWAGMSAQARRGAGDVEEVCVADDV
ncbi:hypothetical protein OG698_07195 [Streptomyces sp. NBC_01003]|uniref:hypothetical protein n=1 Tax=Streptomyces sp. NBC_01003 TaxID=2903714 RepID=UPI003863DC49|nr:hypothetical protein OG698_07195 [Streptomyces sp. NBC_01003]